MFQGFLVYVFVFVSSLYPFQSCSCSLIVTQVKSALPNCCVVVHALSLVQNPQREGLTNPPAGELPLTPVQLHRLPLLQLFTNRVRLLQESEFTGPTVVHLLLEEKEEEKKKKSAEEGQETRHKKGWSLTDSCWIPFQVLRLASRVMTVPTDEPYHFWREINIFTCTDEVSFSRRDHYLHLCPQTKQTWYSGLLRDTSFEPTLSNCQSDAPATRL